MQLRRINTLAASSGKCNGTIWRPSVCPSVCPVGIFTVTHQGPACNATSVHFGPTIWRPDILVLPDVSCYSTQQQLCHWLIFANGKAVVKYYSHCDIQHGAHASPPYWRSTQPVTLHRTHSSWVVIIKAMQVVDGTSVQEDTAQVGPLVWGSTAIWRWLCLHQINQVNSRNGSPMMT